MNARIGIRNPKIRRIVTIVVWSIVIILFLGQMIYFNNIKPRQERMGIPVYYNYKERIEDITNKTVYDDDKIQINIDKIETLKDCIRITFNFKNKTNELYEFSINNVKINDTEVNYNNDDLDDIIKVSPNTTEFGSDIEIKHYELDRVKIGKIFTISFETTIQENELVFKVL